MKKPTLIAMCFLLFIGSTLWAQEEPLDPDPYENEPLEAEDLAYTDETYEELEEAVFVESEFAIPSAPAFSLMGITPELVPRPGVVRNFKVDWRIRDYKGAPDLAIEALPIWFLFFNKDDFSSYRQASGFTRMLSTLSVSLSTASFNDVNHLGYALKINLFRAKDPLNDQALLAQYQTEIKAEQANLIGQIAELEDQLLNTDEGEERKVLKAKLKTLRSSNRAIVRNKRADMELLRQEYIDLNWNASMLDVAAGRIYSYDRSLGDSIQLNTEGYGIWLNGGLKSGKHGFISGIVKLAKYGDRKSFQTGLSLRYGNPNFNFYLETMYERAKETFDPEFDPFQVHINNYRLAYGGDFRLSRGILLNFALQTELTDDFKFNNFLPIANVTCLMR